MGLAEVIQTCCQRPSVTSPAWRTSSSGSRVSSVWHLLVQGWVEGGPRQARQPREGHRARLHVRGPQSRSQDLAEQDKRWVDATRRTRLMAPHWLRDAVPLHWARRPGQYTIRGLRLTGSCCVILG